MSDDSKVTTLPGVRAPTTPAANSPSVAVDALAIASASLAIARALAMVNNVPNSMSMAAETRIQDMAYRLGYVRGVLESSNDLLDQFTNTAAVKP